MGMPGEGTMQQAHYQKPRSGISEHEIPSSIYNAKWMKIMRTLCYTLLGLWTCSLYASGTNELRDINIISLPGEKVQITLKMNKVAKKPVSFTIENPARISLDLLNTRNGLRKKFRYIGLGMAQSLNIIQARNRTRIVLNLSKLVQYSTRVKGKNVYIILGSTSGKRRYSKSNFSIKRSQPGRGRKSLHLNKIDFRRGDKGQGRIIINLSRNSAAVDIRRQGDKIVVDFLNSSIPGNLERRLDVLDFATPVKNIDTFRQGNKVRMIITPVGQYEHTAYQSGKNYTIVVKKILPKKIAKSKTGVNGNYNGDKLTLKFQNIEVRAVLQLLADFTGLNIVVSDSVKGSVTLRLKNVPWDQALDIILKTKGLAMRREGNVMRIAPASEISAIEQADLVARKRFQALAPLQTEWFQINYAAANDILKTIKNKSASLLSRRGRAVVDKRTNTLMVRDTTEQLLNVRRLIKRLDIPVRQVLIESRVVIANKNFALDLGVKFGLSNSTTINNGNDFVTAGGPQNTNGTLSNTLMVDMGVTPTKSKAGRFGIALGALGSNILQLELSALQAEGRGEIVSSPRVITSNQRTAYIEQGLEIPYSQSTSSGAATVSFKKAVLSLKVTPQITPDDRVIMDLEIKKDSADLTTSIGVAQNIAINTREIKTQVLVNNGETIVLGGIYESVKDNKVNRVPFLGKIPVVGFLFRDKVRINNKSELLIFVTPKIIKDDLNKVKR